MVFVAGAIIAAVKSAIGVAHKRVMTILAAVRHAATAIADAQ